MSDPTRLSIPTGTNGARFTSALRYNQITESLFAARRRKGDTTIDILKLLDELESLVEDSKNLMGLTFNLDRDEFFELTNKIRVALPDEVRKASRVTAESERIVGGARETAEQTLMDAQAEAQRILQNSQSSAEKLTRETEAKVQQRAQESDAAANRLVSDAKAQAQQLVETAHQNAEKTVMDAHHRAEQLISDSEIIRLATVQAKDIVSSAEYEAREMRRGAEEYAREEMYRLEKVLSDGLLTVQRGRMKLDQRLAFDRAGTGAAATTIVR